MGTTQQILINTTPYETRVAITENGVLQELHLERAQSAGQSENRVQNSVESAVVGNIYKAKVKRLLPGMQAAFIDIGLAQNGFLHLQDILRTQAVDNASTSKPAQSIQDLIHEGQSIYVQVSKCAVNDKGPRLSTEISLPARNLVYLPNGSGVGVSHKIIEQRQQIKNTVVAANAKVNLEGGLVIRTCAATASEYDIVNDMTYLKSLWSDIQKTIQDTVENNKQIALIYRELTLTKRVLRDFLTDTADKIYIDAEQEFDQLLTFSSKFFPAATTKLEQYSSESALFDSMSIDDQVEAALLPKVALECGGNIVIEQTESMTTIDVNTASFVGGQSATETILKTNLEAAKTIAEQLRLRNIGGIVIIDFIDMQTTKDKATLLESFKKQLAKDRMPTNVSEISGLGLVELTRQRSNASLAQLMCEPCPTCQGSGSVKSAQTVCYEIVRKLSHSESRNSAITIMAAPAVIALLSEQQADMISRLSQSTACDISLRAEAQYQHNQYDIALA